MGARGPLFELTDHVCRSCFARVLKGDRPAEAQDDHAARYVCSNCGAEAVSRLVSSVCACGIRLKSGRDAGIRCERNASPSPEFPNLITAAQSVPAS